MTHRAIRFYETSGLLQPRRDHLGYRRYDEAAMDRLMLIAIARRARVPVREVGEVLKAYDVHGPTAARAELVDACERRLADIEEQRRLIGEVMTAGLAAYGAIIQAAE